MKRIFFRITGMGCVAAVLTVSCLCAVSTARESLEADLDRAVNEFLDTYKTPGLAVGVVKGGKRIYAKGFGIADPEKNTPVTAHSLFHMASVSKTFVATAVMQLAEEGKIDLLFEEAGGWVLVDYKTDVLPQEREDLDEYFCDKYAGQIRAYVEALGALPVKVEAAYLLLARTGEGIEIPLS